jgi:AmmeMemoRadiSam system protein A
MDEEYLSPEVCDQLLKLARQALDMSVRGKPLPELDLEALPPKLRQEGATFVTLTKYDRLRGCIGTLEAYRPLAEDVRQHAIAAAFNDYRFPNVTPDELAEIDIEVSCLTEPKPLEYDGEEELLGKLRPGVDGVVLRAGNRRSTFLPQVWEKLPDPTVFLNQLCMKMGMPPDFWRKGDLVVETYQVQEFRE